MRCYRKIFLGLAQHFFNLEQWYALVETVDDPKQAVSTRKEARLGFK